MEVFSYRKSVKELFKEGTLTESSHHLGSHAIVIGGGMAGLLAARVLTNHFERITLIERDHYPAEPLFRSGIPQGRHVHVLLTNWKFFI